MPNRRLDNGKVQRLISDLRIGDSIDLENDPIADPGGCNEEFTFEFAEVIEIDRETAKCICIYTSQGAFGFPPDHWININPSVDR